MLENTKNQSRYNPKKCSSNPQGVNKKEKQRKEKEKQKTKAKKIPGRFRYQLINKNNLNVNGLNFKKRDCQIRLNKNKTRIYAIYQRPTSDLETHTD